MEFFDSTQDAALAKFADGKSDVDGLLAETDWYGAGNYSFEYYRPMFETARKRGFRIVGLNVPRQLVRAASKADSSGLSPEQRSLVGELGPIDARHEYMVDRMMGALGASMPDAFAGMYRGQTVWDSAMATSIVRAAHNEKSGAKATIVVIVGSGHMAHGLAIPARLASIQPGLKVRTLAPVEAVRPDPKVPVHPGLKASETATFSRGLADYVYVLPDEGGEEAYPRPGVRLEQAKEGPEAGAPRVASVAPGGLMERAGLAPGDIVRRIAGSAPASLSEARRLFAGMRWGDRTIIDVQRSGKDVALPVLVVPPTDGDEDWLKSREPVCVAPGFNPVSDGSFADPPPRAAGRAARIVRFRDKPVRIDVLDGKRLVEAWKLDESGRVSEGLTADPSADGAVRIVYERDPSGTVTAERRFDPDRREIRK
jgi:hypothetical protein